MPQSSTSKIRLKGAFKKLTSDMKKKMMYLKNKLPLTQNLIIKFFIIRFHYESIELLLQDYKSYIINFLK